MKKRVLSFFTLLCMLFTVMSFQITPVSAAVTEESFAAKISELQKTFVDGQYWNKYSSSDYSRTGTVKCKCTGKYCAGTCSCSCGQFYYKNKWYGGQCHGYALKLGYLIFGSVATVSWSKHYNAYNVYAGDLVRVNKDGHSIFVYKVVGNTIYYTECNNSAPCQVKWNRTITKAALASKVTYVLHNSSYKLTGTGTVSSNTEPNRIHTDNTAHVRNGFFTLKNVSSGRYMNVYGGKDANGTKVTMWGYDDSTDQQFNVVHKGNGKYKLYAVSSSNGTNRVVDVYRNGAAPAAGQVIDLWDPNDDTAQLFYIVPLPDGSYVFELAARDGYVIAPTNASTANTNGSQLTLQQYTGASYQKWKFCTNNGGETYPVGSYSVGSYTVNTNGVTLTMRSGAGGGNAKVTSIPDGTTLNVTQVNENWGYTSYNGYTGWVCLDFTMYAPSVTSISIYTEPYLMRYFEGDQLDTSGLEITVTYSNGSTKNITSGFTVSSDFSTTGTKTVTVTYSGKTATFDVEVKAIAISELAIATPALKTRYYVGDTIDTSGLTLTAEYNNDSSKTISNGFTASYDFSTAGTKTVTITYEGLSVSYKVTVENNGYATVSASSDKAKAYYHDELTVSFDLSDTQNVYDGNFNVVYDPAVLEVISAAAGNALNSHSHQINTAYEADKVRLTFAGTSTLEAGNLLQITFKVISDKTESTSVLIDSLNMYTDSGNAANTTANNAGITIEAHDYTITDLYFLDENDQETDNIPSSKNFYAGIKFNKNTSGTARPCILFAVYDANGKMLAMRKANNRYSQGDNLSYETDFTISSGESAASVKAFIWNSTEGLTPLSNLFQK